MTGPTERGTCVCGLSIIAYDLHGNGNSWYHVTPPTRKFPMPERFRRKGAHTPRPIPEDTAPSVPVDTL